MDEKELIAKIEKLREIKPDKKWVFLTKRKILGTKQFFPFFQPAYAGLFLILLFIGIFSASKLSLPGDPFYSLKKIGEETQKVFLSEEEKPKANLELANKKLEELKKIAEKNDVKRLAPAMKEFQANISQAKENLVKSGKIDKEIVKETLTLVTNAKEVEDSYGLDLELKELVEYLIKGVGTLPEEKQASLEKAKEYFENEDYDNALKVLLNEIYNE